MNTPNLIRAIVLMLSICANNVFADNNSDLLALQHQWAETNYQLKGKAQLSAFEALTERVTTQLNKNPDSAELLTWSGIIKSTYAGAKGGLGALSLAKASKADLEKALNINPEALNGSAYTSLGTLYHNVPGWPIGFGNDKTAETMLKKALELNPNGIDSNYFYGCFLLDKKRYQEARNVLTTAALAPKRPNRPLADSGRLIEIEHALAKVNKKLNN